MVNFVPDINIDFDEGLSQLGDSIDSAFNELAEEFGDCLLYTSPSPRDATLSRMPSSA